MRPGQEPEAVCPGCGLFETKPGNQPRDLIGAISAALELDTLKECGATFAYPDALSSFQWACLKGLINGRALSNEKDMQRRLKEQQQQQGGDGFGSLVGRIQTGSPVRPIK